MMGVRQSVRYHMSDIFMVEQCSLMRIGDHTCLGILTGMRSVKNTQKIKKYIFSSSSFFEWACVFHNMP